MDMITGRIVVGYDGSDQSGLAVDWAAGRVAQPVRAGARSTIPQTA